MVRTDYNEAPSVELQAQPSLMGTRDVSVTVHQSL